MIHLLLLLVSSFSWADTENADWQRAQVQLRMGSVYDCAFMEREAYATLDSLGARDVRTSCGNDRYLWIEFESLRKRVDGGVLGEWRSFQWTRFIQDPRLCVLTADVMDAILRKIEKRGLSSGVFCQSGGGSLMYVFEALLPENK
jgi:hypothetical protein